MWRGAWLPACLSTWADSRVLLRPSAPLDAMRVSGVEHSPGVLPGQGRGWEEPCSFSGLACVHLAPQGHGLAPSTPHPHCSDARLTTGCGGRSGPEAASIGPELDKTENLLRPVDLFRAPLIR